MNIKNMTRKDFESLPFRENWDKDFLCDGIVILPLRTKHDSGFRRLDFVACIKNEAICRLSGCSDVIHIGGIGGYGHRWLNKYGTVPTLIPPADWSIDCLLKSGLLRLWCDNGVICGSSLSSFEIYAKEKELR